MNSFKLELFDGHAIIKDGENIILIDTGSPSTIHVSDSLNFCSEVYSCTQNYLGMTVQELSELLGKEITTLLGTDILSEYKILFDYKNERVEFSKGDIEFTGNEIEISVFMGIPIIELSIDGQNLKFFLDTGAKLSYLKTDITNNYQSIGQVEDFYPGVGKFQTNCFEILTSFDNQKFLVKYGNLPPLLQMTLMMGGANGIIGFDFFNNFRILLDLENEKLKYEA
jgi:hypothetical protein